MIRMRIVLLLVTLAVSSMSFAKPPGRRFIENKNQWDKEIFFASRIPGGSMKIRPGGFAYFLIDEKTIEEHHHAQHLAKAFSEEKSQLNINGVYLTVDFVGADKTVVPVGFGKSSEYYNYFIGNDRSKWASEVNAFNGVFYKSFYNGIDLKVYAVEDNLKYDLVVAPGADPSKIAIRYGGYDNLRLTGENDIVVETILGDIIEKKPVAYQYIGGKKKFVTCEFTLDNGHISFVFPDGFDSCYELVIDPLLIFSTFSGSEADNWASTATYGEHGSLYSAGITNHLLSNGAYSGTFPATTGSFQIAYGGTYDVAILKYDSLGENLLYASYLGGRADESAHSLVVNKDNELVILGNTGSDNFPTSTNAYDRSFNGGKSNSYTVFPDPNGTDIFLARISPDGKSLLGCTYLGGPANDGVNDLGSPLRKNYGDDLRGDIITDDDGNIYVSTVTNSDNIPAKNLFKSNYDALILKMPPALNAITWALYMGGTGYDAAHSIKFGKNNNLYVAGGTTSSDFPVTAGAAQTTFGGEVDGWVAEIDLATQTVQNATYTGSSAYDQAYFVDVNAAEEIYLYGQTNGDRPVTPPDIYHNPGGGQFLQKFNPDLSQQLFYTVFGSGSGVPDISPTAFLVNECNNLFVAGWGGALNQGHIAIGFPLTTANLTVTEDAYQKTTAGHDFYLMVLSPDAQERLYATFLGGNISYTHVDGGTSRFDKDGLVYHAVCAGCGNSWDDFPTTPGVVSRTNNSLSCNNAAFKFDLSTLKAVLTVQGSNKVCIPEKVVFDNASLGGEKFFWNFGDGTPIVEQDNPVNMSHAYKNPGTYTVWLKAYDPGTCATSDSVSVNVYIGIAEASFPDDTEVCFGESKTLTASGGLSYEWFTKDGKYHFFEPSITVSPPETTTFYINVTEEFGCVSRDSVVLRVVPGMNPEFSFEREADCLGKNNLIVKNLTDSLMAGDHLYFDFGDGSTSDLPEVEHIFENSGQYNIKLVGVREFCVTEEVIPLTFGPLKFPNVITPEMKDGLNDAFGVQYGDAPGPVPSDYGFKTNVVIYDRWGKLVYENSDYKYDWTGSDLPTGTYYYEVTVEEHATCKGWVHLVK
jgi:gliding motility-associated-like protein